MKRIDTATRSVDLFGAGKDGFRNSNKGAGISATQVDADWCNHLQEELANVIEGQGIALDPEDRTQLSQAIEKALKNAQRSVILDDAVFDASVADGEAVYWDSANSLFDEAIADGTGKQNAVGIADVTNSKVYAFGSCPILSGLTPGSKYYLSDAVAGAITTTQPSANVVQVGIAKSATELVVDIDQSGGSGVSPGTVSYFAGSTAPAGYLKLNGAGILVASYPALTTAVYVGDANNATAEAFYRADNSDGSSRNIAGAYLILRDARGEFFRAWDDGRGVDSGRVFGSAQSDQFQTHVHGPGTGQFMKSGINGGINASSGTLATYVGGNTGGPATGNTGSETRPRNIALLAVIKY